MGRKAVSKFLYCNMIAFTLFLAGITLAAVFAQYISPSKSFILPFIGLSLSFLLIGNILLMLYWILRLRVWFVVPILAIACNYQYLERIFRFSSSPGQQLVNVLKVATFNADSFGKEWTAAATKDLANYMNKNGVDVLCFQEFGFGSKSFPIDSIYQAFKKWPYHYVPISPAGHNCLQLAVFSKYPIGNSLLMTFKDTPNCALWCDIDMNGKMMRLFNLHLQTTNVSSNMTKIKESVKHFNFISGTFYHTFFMLHEMEESYVMRAEQAEYIHDKIKESPYPVILCGDFNSLPSSYSYHTILGNELKDGFCLAGRGYMYTFRYLKHLFRIDYIMTSAHWKALDYYSPHIDFHSDHNPVVMTMKMN